MAKPTVAPDHEAVAPQRAAFNFKAILQQMVQLNASDLHLKVGRPPTLRVNGDLSPLPLPALRPEDLTALAKELMTPKQVKEFSEYREADFATGVPGIGRFRVNAYQQRGTIAFALRTIPHTAKSCGELNLPAVVEEISMRPRGLVLVTGITGSGKSTALASMIQHINERRYANIITIEDPIEFLHRDNRCHINQREVGTDTGSFAQALRRVLRQDPDVILLGEIRDLDTLETALKAADTGHLVFSTLHTTDATQTINRVLSFYPPHQQGEVRFSLASALQAVISLRLVPRADRAGRIPAVEVLINTAAVRQRPRHGKDAQHSRSHQGRRGAVRNAELRSIAHAAVLERQDFLRERGILRNEPGRVRAARARRRGHQRHVVVWIRGRGTGMRHAASRVLLLP